MAVRNKLRFEVFRRDNWQCRYCGRAAKDGAVLEPDHVIPRARGGKDVATNLVTACEACNSGKSDTPISAPPIEDVPQEFFRRACADRGITDLPYGVEEGRTTSLMEEIRCNYSEEEWLQIAQGTRRWLEDYEDPTVEELEVRVARDAFLEEQLDRQRLERVVSRLLLLHPPEEMEPYHRAADEYIQEASTEPLAVRDRPAARLVRTADFFLQGQERLFFAALPEEQQAEWMEYSVAWHGPHDPQDPWSVPEEYARQNAPGLAFFISRTDHHYQVMCCARGQHIPACPRRRKYVVRLGDCRACLPGEADGHSGHLFCETHLRMIHAGEYVTRAGVTLVATAVAEFKAPV